VIQSFTGVKEIQGSFDLLYSGKRDGYSGEEFHKRCDGKRNTLTLYHVFGAKDSTKWIKLAAFTEDVWDSESGLKKGDGKCWMAILESSSDNGPELLNHSETAKTINCKADLGPSFGDGDISISGTNFTQSSINLGKSFSSPNMHGFFTSGTWKILTPIHLETW
jgi:hypothetical protein